MIGEIDYPNIVGINVSFGICDRRYYCDTDKAIDNIVSWMKENTDELD